MPQNSQPHIEYFPEDAITSDDGDNYADLSYQESCDLLWDGENDDDTELFDDIIESDRLYGTCGNPGVIFRPAPVVAKSGVIQHCSIRQLKIYAKGRVKNYSNLTKPELIAALS